MVTFKYIQILNLKSFKYISNPKTWQTYIVWKISPNHVCCVHNSKTATFRVWLEPPQELKSTRSELLLIQVLPFQKSTVLKTLQNDKCFTVFLKLDLPRKKYIIGLQFTRKFCHLLGHLA